MEQNQEMNLPNQVDKVEVREAIVSAPDSVVEDKNAGAAGGGEAGKQKKMGSAILMAVLVILALGGVAFGAFAMVTSGSEIAKKDDEISKLKVQVGQADGTKAELEMETITITNPDGSTVEISDGGIDNALAQNLINPYIGSFGYLANIFDFEFDENSKFFVSFLNLNERDITNTNGNAGDNFGYIIYDTINDEYKELFGSDGNLSKSNYSAGYYNFNYSADTTWGGGKFEMSLYGGGGAGSSMFSVVKEVYYSGNDLIVEVYHDVLTICGASDEEYCMDTDVNVGIVVNDINGANVAELIKNYSDRIPVYKMRFARDNGHYVLRAIEK